MKTLIKIFSIALVTIGFSTQAQAQDGLSNAQTTLPTVNATIEPERGDFTPPSTGGGKDLGFSISVFPNPGNGNFTLTLPGNRSHQVLVTDLYGNRIYMEQAMMGQTSLQMELGNVPAGLYRVLVDEYSVLYRKL